MTDEFCTPWRVDGRTTTTMIVSTWSAAAEAITPEFAARIVACVNACAGMQDPALEIAKMRDALNEVAP